MKIVSLVMNTAARDARVVKAAQSLIKAGHDVTIIGIKDNNYSGGSALLDSGLQVHRVGWRAEAYRRAGAIYIRMMLAGLAAGLVFVAALLWGAQGILAAAGEMLLRFWTAEPSFVAAAGVGGGFAVVGQGVLYAVKISILAAVAVIFLLAVRFVARRGFKVFDRGFLSKLRRITAAANQYAEDDKAHAGPGLIFDFIAAGPGQAVADLSTELNDRILSGVIRKVRLAAMVELALEFKPDIVHSHEVMTLPAAERIKKLTGAKIIYDAHELYEDLAQAPPQVLESHRRTHADYLKYTDRMITVNESIGRVYKRTYPVVGDPVIIKNATKLMQLPAYDGRLHEAANLPQGQKILLYQGGFAKKRGLETLVRAGALLPDHWSLVMMGWGRSEDELRAIVDEDIKVWMAAAIADRRRKIVAEIPDDLKQQITAGVEAAYLGRGVLSQESPDRGAQDEPADESGAGKFELQAVETIPLPRREQMLARLLTGGDKRSDMDPFNYEDDPAVAALEHALSTIVNLRLDIMNIEAPLSNDEYNKVRFVPPAAQDELALWTQGATVGIIPYENDGLNHWFCSPNKLWEYPNAGVPILASSFPELHKTVIGNGIGWILPSDPGATDIARVIANLTGEEIAAKRGNCRTFIERDNWSVYEQRLIECFASVGAAGYSK